MKKCLLVKANIPKIRLLRGSLSNRLCAPIVFCSLPRHHILKRYKILQGTSLTLSLPHVTKTEFLRTISIQYCNKPERAM